MTLLLVDTAVAQYETILAAAQPTVTTVLFDRAVDTFTTLKEKIAAASTHAQTVGIVQHGSGDMPYYKMLETQVTPAIVTDAEQSDPTLDTWTQLIDFYRFLKARGAQTIDLISCSLYSNAGWVYVLQELEKRLGIDFRASINATGNVASGGDWIQESDGVNIQDIYFTADISEYTNILFVCMYSYQNVMAAKPGTTIGSYTVKGDINSMRMTSQSAPTNSQFEILRTVKGNIVYNWGSTTYGNLNATVGTTSDVVSLCNNLYSACYLKSDGSVFSWGNSGAGGSATSASAANSGSPVVGILGVESTIVDLSFQCYVALRQDGTVYTWGNSTVSTNSMVAVASSGSPAVALYATKYSSTSSLAFAALREDGSVAAFGNTAFGGSNTQASLANSGSPVRAICANAFAFAALRENGTVYAWGSTSFGGSNSQAVLASSGSPVVALQDTQSAFAALRQDGSVYAWGSTSTGGNNSQASFANSGSPVVTISSTSEAFAALRQDGSVYAWGSTLRGGSNTQAAAANSGSPVIAISAANVSFVALRQDGTVYSWGDSTSGATNSVVTAASSGSLVVAICSMNIAHACLRTDGTVYTFGNGITNGMVSGITSANPAINIAASAGAFCALRADGTVTAWGSTSAGGSNTTAQNAGSSGIVLLKSGTYGFTTVRSTNVVPSSASNALTNNLFGNYICWSTDSTDTVTLSCRTEINALSGASQTATQLEYIRSMAERVSGPRHRISSSQLTAFKNTLISGASNLSFTLPVDQYFPNINARNTSAVLDISNFSNNNTAYNSIELPINIPTVLVQNGLPVKTLFFDGTNVRDGSTGSSPIIAPGSSLTIGTKLFKDIAIGSLVGLGGVGSPLPPVPRPARPTVRDDTITYYWDPAIPDETIVNFTFTLTPEGDTPIVQSFGPNDRQYTFTGLTIGTTYSASITMTNPLGTSAAASYTDAQPSSPPSAPTVQSGGFVQDGNTLTITWTAPASVNGSPVQGYLIYDTLSVNTRYPTGGQRPPNRYCIEPWKTSHTVVGIPAGSYKFAIVPYNSSGYGTAAVDPDTKIYV